MTEQQFQAAMRTFRLELEYMEYIKERIDLKDGDNLFNLMNSGDFLQGFKEKMTGSQKINKIE